MIWKNTDGQFGLVAKLFHWVMALLVFLLLTVGFQMTGIAFGPDKLWVYGIHKSFGILVLMLAALRLIWRVYSRPPMALSTHVPWEKTLSKLTHFVLYGALFLMPLSGWVMSSAGDFPVRFFGLFELPDLVAKNKDIFESAKEIHEILAFVLLAALVLHIAGVLKHHFIDRDVTLKRMTVQTLGFVGGAVLAVLAGILFLLPVTALLTSPEEGETPAEISQAVLSPSSGGWTIVKEGSRIEFTAMQDGEGFSGIFKNFDGAVIFDSENLADARADILIDISSIDTGSADRDLQARTADWFDTQSYPQAEFKAVRFEHQNANRYVAYGDLTIRGVSVPVALPFDLTISDHPQGGRQAVMTAALTLNRLDFGIGQGQWKSAETIGDSVNVTIALTAVQGGQGRD